MADKVREAGCPDGYGDRHAAKCENAVVAARVIEGAWGDGYIAGRRAALDAPLAAPSGGDATPSAREIREACVKHVADAIAACYRRAWTSPDEMRGATGALKRLAVSMANLPLPPAPAASAPAAIRDLSGDLAAMAKGIDEECCCVACGREVAPSPCCPDYPVWPGPCRSCYSIDATPADDAVARARERWERASRRYFDARLALAAAYDLASLNVAAVGERAAAREAKDAYDALLAAYDALLAAERAAKGGEKEATQGTCSRCGYLAMPPACTKCYSPYPAPASRDGGAAKGGERG